MESEVSSVTSSSCPVVSWKRRGAASCYWRCRMLKAGWAWLCMGPAPPSVAQAQVPRVSSTHGNCGLWWGADASHPLRSTLVHPAALISSSFSACCLGCQAAPTFARSHAQPQSGAIKIYFLLYIHSAILRRKVGKNNQPTNQRINACI